MTNTRDKAVKTHGEKLVKKAEKLYVKDSGRSAKSLWDVEHGLAVFLYLDKANPKSKNKYRK